MAAKLRADAELNRERILAVSRELLTASADTSMNAIAKAAGVGPGTLYRHFPTREALLLAVYWNDVQALVRRASEILAERSGADALRQWFLELADSIRLKHGLPEAFNSVDGEALVAQTYAPVLGAIDELLAVGRADGTITSDIPSYDLLLLMGFLWRIEPGPGAEARADRMLDLVFAALRP